MIDSARTIAVTGAGFCTALGVDPIGAVARGETAVRECEDLQGLAHRSAATVDRIDLRSWLKRRKDRKLMARPSQLALAAGGMALEQWDGETDALGLFVGVGREPGDDGESEPSLVAAQVDGRLNEAAVAGPCRDLYPPLLPLKTLPNMALAHISIHLDIRGDNGTWCGGSAAGLMALRAAILSVQEGRSEAALVVAADSWVSEGCVRDLLRMSAGRAIEAPGEAGVALFIESMASAIQRGAPVFGTLDLDTEGGAVEPLSHHESLGDCKAADALLALALRLGQGAGTAIYEAQEPGQPPIAVGLTLDGESACYPADLGGSDDV